MDNEIARRRLIQNEQTSKERNIEVKDSLKNLFPVEIPISFICECSDEDCHEHIDLTPSEYDFLHQNKKHYIIKIGHDTPSVEKVVRQEPTFEVVEKFILN